MSQETGGRPSFVSSRTSRGVVRYKQLQLEEKMKGLNVRGKKEVEG